MSRLRVPFRKQSSSVPSPALDIPVKEIVEEPEAPPTIVVEKGREHEVERLWGLENFGNTCYCNSVLQALYACEPFRKFVQSYPDAPAPVTPLAPAPGELIKTPGSPLTTKTNPFDNPTLNNNASPSPADKKRGLFTRRPTNTPLPLPTPKETSTFPPILTSSLDVPPVAPNPEGPPPTVFETIQTLFNHLSSSLPHQPLPARKDAKANAETAQTASLLPAEMANGPPSPTTTPGNPPPVPQGPPLLASLPPPSAPRGGGPFQAGTLGRGVVRPEDLLKTVKRENEMFRGMSQQDAHEFLGWVLNKVAEDIDVVDRSLREVGKEVSTIRGHGKTFIQNLFEGILTNETRCLSCETTSSRDELFLDLSIDIEQHSSVTACLRQFSASEMLCQKNKFFCDSCCGLQEAEKRMKIKRLPHVLALHLKRFKYQETLGRYTKLFYRVPFPTQLRLPNTSDDTEDPDRLYELFSVVVHIGNGPHHGHYVCLIRSGGRWVMCDDENIEPIDDADIYRYFGDYPSGAGYVLFYQAVDLDLPSLGLKVPSPNPQTSPSPANGLVNIPEQAEKPASPVSAPVPAPVAAPDVAPIAAPDPVPAAKPNVAPMAASKPSTDAPIAFIQPRRSASTVSALPPSPAPMANPITPAPTSPVPPSPVPAIAVASPPPAPAAKVISPPSQPVITRSPSPTPPTPSPVPANGAKKEEKWYRRKSTTSREGSISVDIGTVSNSASSTASTTQLGPASLGRTPSSRDRTVSNSSQSSATPNTTDKYSGGGGLSRRLSGMSVGKIGRSGSMSFGKLGFGKKDKNGIAE